VVAQAVSPAFPTFGDFYHAPARARYTGVMDIDSRLDRLTERHEALTLTAELLTRDIQDL
jgi:hypothetical protein